MHFEQALIEHGALTLAGLKPASLFRFLPRDGKAFIARFLECREELAKRGLRLVILKGCRKTGSYLLCLYRERELTALLARTEYRQFLYSMGYRPWDGVRGCLRQLAVRLCLEDEFPHEIGVFLGYPLEDVTGFIALGGRNYTCSGCWKCYGDPEAAQRRFARYRRCTELYRRRYAQGATLGQLTVAA